MSTNLVVGTYRPVELILHDHPLKLVKQELAAHGQCVEIPLSWLSPQAVAAYVAQRGGRQRAARTWRRLYTSAPRGIPCSWCRWWTI